MAIIEDFREEIKMSIFMDLELHDVTLLTPECSGGKTWGLHLQLSLTNTGDPWADCPLQRGVRPYCHSWSGGGDRL